MNKGESDGKTFKKGDLGEKYRSLAIFFTVYT